MASGGDWLQLQEQLERGDPEFVDRIREIADADALGAFAERWYSNPSPNARRLLLAYLERPLNAFRHEALVKRLFKHAEAAGDDAVMARLLVALDRSIRRIIRKRHHYERRAVNTLAEAERVVAEWKAQGFDHAQYWRKGIALSSQYQVWGSWSEPFIITRGGTTMPRGALVDYSIGWDWVAQKAKTIQAPDWVGKLELDPRKYHDTPLSGDKSLPPESSRKKLDHFRLFSIATRRYLRRRAWRFFRKLGKLHPERYVPAISDALMLYEDADVHSGLAFIDNWGLVHALFHDSPVLPAHPRGWRVAEGRALSELEPAPIYEHLWGAAPRTVFDLTLRARSRPVRQWALRMLRRDLAGAAAAVGIEDRVGLLGHVDPEVVAFAAEWLRASTDLASVRPGRWLAVAETASLESLATLAEIMAETVDPGQVSLADAARLAASRPLPLARLGLSWLQSRIPATDDERRSLSLLLEAQAEPLRGEILAWLRSVLAASSDFHPDWVLEFLDSRFDDARAEGMCWFRAEPRAHDDVLLWQRLLESPYDDVRMALAADLDARLKQGKTDGAIALWRDLSPDRLRLLWASVLLNVRRGGRVKPRVVEQVAQRLARRPQEAELLLPLLGIALRSLRLPERRAALAAVVRLVADRPDAAPLVRKSLPELQWA